MAFEFIREDMRNLPGDEVLTVAIAWVIASAILDRTKANFSSMVFPYL